MNRQNKNNMKNKLNIHKVEELGFFIVIAVVSIIVGMAILVGAIKLVDLLNK
jgi:hypothetical protein